MAVDTFIGRNRPTRPDCPGRQCTDCSWPITWAEQRRQFGRCLRRGLTEAEAKAASPRCQKCMTKHLRATSPESGEGEP